MWRDGLCEGMDCVTPSLVTNQTICNTERRSYEYPVARVLVKQLLGKPTIVSSSQCIDYRLIYEKE